MQTFINCVFIGDNILGDDVTIGANAVVINSQIRAGTNIHANCHIENANIGENCELGPFARIRPDTVLAENVKVGNFVEVKASTVGESAKVSHLSYIGDAQVGKQVNIGAGVVTRNYDGVNKYKTTIADHAFIGSNTSLIAPVNIGEDSTIGAGSVITKNTPEDKLVVARSSQKVIEGWERPKKKLI